MDELEGHPGLVAVSKELTPTIISEFERRTQQVMDVPDSVFQNGFMLEVEGAETELPIPVNSSSAAIKRKADADHPEAPQGRRQEMMDTGINDVELNKYYIPKRVMKGMTNIPCLHIGSRTGSEGSKTANLYKAIEPAQPETRAVCIICTASNRPGSFNTTV